MRRAAARPVRWCASTARPSPAISPRRSCSATPAAPSPERRRRAADSSRRRTAGRWCSTRWASCPCRCKPSYSGRCKKERSSPSARAAWRGSTCAWSPAPTATSPRRLARAVFARTSITVSRWWSFWFLRCTSTARTFQRWPGSSCAAMPSGSGWTGCALLPSWSMRCSAPTGRATYGSSRTRSPAWWRWAAAARSVCRRSPAPRSRRRNPTPRRCPTARSACASRSTPSSEA